MENKKIEILNCLDCSLMRRRICLLTRKTIRFPFNVPLDCPFNNLKLEECIFEKKTEIKNEIVSCSL